MNIFVLSLDPREAAQLHCDKHVIKMIIESAQMLYSAHWALESSLPSNAYKQAHTNHPCSKWVRESLDNYLWLCELAKELCNEYRFRYGETKVHKTEAHIDWLIANYPDGISNEGFTNPAQAMPDEYKDDDVVVAYRRFYRESKMKARNIVTYKKRSIPDFLMSI
jgi:Pyrimidine dimer DNA glycosylase